MIRHYCLLDIIVLQKPWMTFSKIFFSNFNRLNEYAKMPKSYCLLLTVFVRVTSEVQRNADFLVGFLRFISTTISLEN